LAFPCYWIKSYKRRMPEPVPSSKLVDEIESTANDPDLSIFSSPPKTSEPLMSSPQGNAPKPLATLSPIATPPTKSNLLSSSSHVNLSSSTTEVGAVLQSVTSRPDIGQEDLKTPKARVSEDVKEATSPTKKNSSKEKCPALGSRKALFNTKGRQSKTTKAGLVFSVARVLSKLKDGQYSRRVGVTGAVYLASVLEYLVAEVLELAGNCARFYKKKRVTPRCIQLSLLHDKELAMLTRGVVIPDGGVKPYIHPVLMKKGSVEEQQKDSGEINNNNLENQDEKEESHGD